MRSLDDTLRRLAGDLDRLGGNRGRQLEAALDELLAAERGLA